MRPILNEYKTNVVRLFLNDVSVNNYYLFASTIDSEIILKNTVADKKEFLNKTLFGKIIDPSETFLMIKNYPWQPGKIFEQYDDTVDLTNKMFYTVVYPENSNTGSYLVFKCLFNNYGQTSEVAPFYEPGNGDQIYNTADGYVWKFMYSISVKDFDQYNTLGYIPIIEENAPSISDFKSISHIQVENPDLNYGYDAPKGVIRRVNNENISIESDKDSTLNSFTNFYRGQTIYVTNSNNVSKLYDILSYNYNTNTKVGTIRVKNLDSFITAGSTYTILPKIVIQGDGQDASAIPIIANRQIKRIIMINKGHGYNSAIAYVKDPEFGFNPNNSNTSDKRAIIRPILAPGDGHGTDIAKELHCNSVLLYTRITEADNLFGVIPTVNTYARIGIVKNPRFKINPPPSTFDNRIYVDFETQSFFAENERVFQVDETTSEVIFEAKVHETANNAVYLAEYVGPYQNIGPDPTSDVSFNPNLPLRSESNQTYIINTSITSDYIQRTGEVIYIASYVSPIFRTKQSQEQFKILLQF